MNQSKVFSQWLEERIKSFSPGEKLPSAVELARKHDISAITVHRVLKILENKNLVIRIRGKGTFIPRKDKIKEDIEMQPKKTASEDLAHAFYRLICNGTLKRGDSLPPIKVVALKYMVSNTTVIAAYKILHRQNHVTKIGKRYWVGTFEPNISLAKKKEVYLFVDSSLHYSNFYTSHKMAPVFRTMETELIRNDYQLRYHTYDEFAILYRTWEQNSEAVPNGIILLEPTQETWDTLRKKIIHIRQQSEGAMSLLAVREFILDRRIPGMNILLLGSIFTQFCREIARYIVNSRYIQVLLYFNEAAGNKEDFASTLKIRTELKYLNPEIIFYSYVKPLPGTSFDQFIQRAFYAWPRQWIENILGKYHKTTIESLFSEITLVKNFSDTFHDLHPDRLLLFGIDADAFDALQYLENNGYKVPEDVSIMGLTNEPQYFHKGITSCVEDFHGIGYLMAHAVINDFPLEKTGRGYILTKSIVHKRKTTR